MTKKEIVLLVLAGLLFFIWPIPHSTSPRELLLIGATGLGVYLYFRNKTRAQDIGWSELRLSAALLLALCVWMLVVAFFISPESMWSLGELRGQWSKALLALVLGITLTAAVARTSVGMTTLMLVLGVGLLVHVVAIDVDSLVAAMNQISGYRADGLTDGTDKASYLTNIMIAILFGDLLTRRLQGRRLLPVPLWAVWLILLLAFFSLYAERVRNGLGVMVAMSVCAVTFWLWNIVSRHSTRRWAAPLAVTVMAIVAAGLFLLAGSVKPGTNWRQFIATAPIALDTENHKGWLNEEKYGRPVLPDGNAIDISAYLRIAWFKEGLIVSGEHPFGVGFGRNAFGHAITAKHGEPKGHSHSSFIDLLVGIGIPGMLLWLGFLYSLLRLAWRNFSGGWGYVLFFIVLDFGARMVVDSNVRDHMSQMFMFLVGVFAALTARQIASDPVVSPVR